MLEQPKPDQMRALVDAILPHVVFDGWTDQAWSAALSDLNLSETNARAIAPRGALDLAVAYHRYGDEVMVERASSENLAELRYSDRVARLIELRFEGADREVVRRATALFALPNHAAEGAALIWGTADAIWTALGDTSDDLNWYSKRAILSGVYGSSVLFWLGDESGGDETRAFIARRIENVMQFERAKAATRKHPILKPFASTMDRLFASVKAPSDVTRDDLPGKWAPEEAK